MKLREINFSHFSSGLLAKRKKCLFSYDSKVQLSKISPLTTRRNFHLTISTLCSGAQWSQVEPTAQWRQVELCGAQWRLVELSGTKVSQAEPSGANWRLGTAEHRRRKCRRFVWPALYMPNDPSFFFLTFSYIYVCYMGHVFYVFYVVSAKLHHSATSYMALFRLKLLLNYDVKQSQRLWCSSGN